MATKEKAPKRLDEVAIGKLYLWRGLKVRVTNIRPDKTIECEGVDNRLHALHIGDASELRDGE